jgi:RimJ/RimL family protein N-acetyltransferase
VDRIPCGIINLADIDMTNKRLELNKIFGESFCINTAAVKMHELCGCKTEGILRRHILKNGQYYDICVQSMLAEEWKSVRNGFKYQHIDFK